MLEQTHQSFKIFSTRKPLQVASLYVPCISRTALDSQRTFSSCRSTSRTLSQGWSCVVSGIAPILQLVVRRNFWTPSLNRARSFCVYNSFIVRSGSRFSGRMLCLYLLFQKEIHFKVNSFNQLEYVSILQMKEDFIKKLILQLENHFWYSYSKIQISSKMDRQFHLDHIH